jgi:hypothetical protein
MADERRKGPPERRSSRTTKQTGDEGKVSPAGVPDVSEQQRAQDPNDVARFDAEELDASIRARQQEDRGEVF